MLKGINMDKAYSKSTDAICGELKTDLTNGLSQAKAEELLAQNGPNSLAEAKKVPLWKKFIAQFADAMVFILIGAAALSAVMAIKEGGGFENWIDVIVILAIIFGN